jgi:Wax ester synthase-like Acyl-CoA acyltransferase domain
MQQLPGLDASFLHLETPQMPMHVGALHNFELPADYDGDFLADMRRHMAAPCARAGIAAAAGEDAAESEQPDLDR